MTNKIYTRKGDKGLTSLADAKRIHKTERIVHAIGSVDELNSAIGVVIAMLNQDEKIKTILIEVQKNCFVIGALLANAKNIELAAKQTVMLEQQIDSLSATLPELKSFILPGVSKPASFCHLARSICRRAERELVAILDSRSELSEALKYLNRLSDLLFTIARFLNHQQKFSETCWP